jgi:hypothetical protein
VNLASEVSQGDDPKLILTTSPADKPTICPDDLFHVTARQQADGFKTLKEGEYWIKEEESHKICMAENVISKMTAFLTHVAQARKVTGHNVES